MLNFIAKLQRKPEATRKKILIASTLLVMGVIFSVWITTLPTRIKLALSSGAEETVPITEAAAPFAVLKQSAAALYGDAKKSIEAFKELRQK